jgi:hypothetical protein
VRVCASRFATHLAPNTGVAGWAPLRPRATDRDGRLGEDWPYPKRVRKEAQTSWPRGRVSWSNGRHGELDVSSGTAVWYRRGRPCCPSVGACACYPWAPDSTSFLRGMPERAATGGGATVHHRMDYGNHRRGEPPHLGLETPRQWSVQAIERTTPCLLCLYVVAARLAHALHPDGTSPLSRTARYDQSQAASADVLAAVRRHLWDPLSAPPLARAPDLIAIPRVDLSRRAQPRYAHCNVQSRA